MKIRNDISLYIHIPFCVQKCKYCDFLSFSSLEEDRNSYIQELKKELQWKSQWASGASVISVFFGGGTPSILRVEQMEELLSLIKEYYTLKEYKKESAININKRIVSFNKDSIDKYVNPLLKENANITMHELRHTYITLLIANGVDFKTVAQIVGDEVEQIYKTYSHVTSDMMNRAAKIINNIFK